MTLQDLTNLAEILASIGIIISLIFVGFQIRQNSNLLERGEENTTMSEWSAIRHLLIGNRDVARIWKAGLEDDNNLDEVDLARLETLFEDHLWAAYHIWDRTRRGLMKHGKFSDTQGPYLKSILDTNYGSKWWLQAKLGFPPSFVKDVDGMILTHNNKIQPTAKSADG